MSAAIEQLKRLKAPTGLDPIQQAGKEFQDAQGPKVNIGIGVVIDEKGKDVVFESFKEAEQIVTDSRKNVARYVPPVNAYLDGMQKMIFSEGEQKNEKLYKGRNVAIDSHGGTNGDWTSLLFWKKVLGGKAQFLVGHDDWPNYENMINWLNLPNHQGQIDNDLVRKYYHATPDLIPSIGDYAKVLEESSRLGRIPVVPTQNGAQNGLGVYRDEKYWNDYLKLSQKHSAVLHFDDPYAGMTATRSELSTLGMQGAMEKDWYPIRKAAEMGLPFSVTSALSKTAGQYDNRVAMSFVNIPNDSGVDIKAVAAEMNKNSRAVNSFTAKSHLAAGEVMSNQTLRDKWLKELESKVMSRIHDGREALARNASGDIKDVIERTRGMFFTGKMPHKSAYEMQNNDGLFTVKVMSPTLAGADNAPVEAIRANVTGIPKGREDEIAKNVLGRITK